MGDNLTSLNSIFTKDEIEYLSIIQSTLNFEPMRGGRRFILKLTSQQAMDLSDKLTDLLMEIGFTEDGEDVNPKGRIIEDIIDKLFAAEDFQ